MLSGMESRESSYTCPSCGEDIVVPVDPSAGASQEYVEDCPVCCCPNRLRIQLDPEGERCWATPD